MTARMTILQTNNNGTFFNPTLLEYIKLKNNAEIFSILKEFNAYHLTDSDGTTLLHFAAKYSNSELVQHLIDSGVDVDVQNHMKQTPLFFAALANEETVRLLLKANADIYKPDVNGQCALGIASKNIYNPTDTQLAILDQVTVESLKSSKYVSSDVFHRNCPIYYFVWPKKTEIAQFLLDNGSPVDAQQQSSKRTALFRAVSQLDVENVKLLLNYNADVNAKDHWGRTPLAYIFPTLGQNEALEVLKILLAAGAILIDYTSGVTMLKALLEYGSKEIIHILLQREIDLMYEDVEGKTLLHFLALNRRTNIFHELLHLDFDVTVRCRWLGRSLLHYAASVGNSSSVKFLLDQGLDVNEKDCYQQTPLFVAIHLSYFRPYIYTDDHLNDYINCVEILLERGADPYIFTEQNYELEFPIFSRYYITDGLVIVITPLLAKLAILEAYDQPMGMFMRNEINSYKRLKDTFDMIKRQVEEMKQIEIDDSMTLLDFLTVDKEIPRFAHKTWLVSNLTNSLKNYSTETYVGRKLHERVLKFSELVEWRETVVFVLNEVLTEFLNLSICNIAEKIVDCIQDEKWKEIK